MGSRIVIPEIVSPIPVAAAGKNRPVSLKDAAVAFLNRSTSENTREAYKRTVLEFCRFVGVRLDGLDAVTPREVQLWRDSLIHHGRSNQTVATKLATVRALFDYLIMR